MVIPSHNVYMAHIILINVYFSYLFELYRSRSGYDSETDDGEDSDDYAMPLGIPIVSSEDGRRLVEYKPSNHSVNKGRWTKEEVSNNKNRIIFIFILYMNYVVNS